MSSSGDDHLPLPTLDAVRDAVAGAVAAARVRSRLVPAGGLEDKVFPATYRGGRYAFEDRRADGAEVRTVLLDSVQSQANRMEEALRAAHERGEIRLPLIAVDFAETLPHIGRITTLDAPHRIADAILRESRLDGTPFRDSDVGRSFVDARATNATALFELCPTALVFGVWDSTGPRGGLGAKFARALVSEIVGFDAVDGVRTASRIDPLPIERMPVYEARGGGWTLNPDEAVHGDKGPTLYRRGNGKADGNAGTPAALNLGNVTPAFTNQRDQPLPGGVTISHAQQIAVLSLPALRRLRFPVNGKQTDDVDLAARVVLAALGIAAIAYHRRNGYDLRSRCLLVPDGPAVLELVPSEGGEPVRYSLDVAAAAEALRAAVDAAKAAGLPWHEEEIVLEPSPQLVELVKRSEEVAAVAGDEIEA